MVHMHFKSTSRMGDRKCRKVRKITGSTIDVRGTNLCVVQTYRWESVEPPRGEREKGRENM